MTIKVIIERYIKEGAEEAALRLMRELRTKAVFRQGYISGETLRAVDEPSLLTIISSWQSVADWEAWAGDPARQEIDAKITQHLKQPEKLRVYTAG
ncbi:MAG: antibiotic biosynthesis monooxygenase [Dehalococcoidia bacterium]|nr:antibiotic biosynthesis monooxygenase [Dehalococcoidia bacterium]